MLIVFAHARSITPDSILCLPLCFFKILTISNTARQGRNNYSKAAFRFRTKNKIVLQILHIFSIYFFLSHFNQKDRGPEVRYNKEMISRSMNHESRITNRKSALTLLILASCFLLLASTPAHAQSVDLLWQGDTYVPPFYQGRTLWSSQSRINFVAMPHDLGNPEGLNYKWTKDGTVLGNINGMGKNTLSFVDSVISKPQVVKIDIISPDKATVLATRSVLVTPITPVLVVYENNPLYGFMFHREIKGEFKLQEQEVTFTAFPFFFSASNRLDSKIGYEWRTNAEGETETNNSVTYRSPDKVVGTSEVKVYTSSTDKILQSANNSFLVQFGI